MDIRSKLAVGAAKAAGYGSRLLGKGGTTFSGKVALKMSGSVLEELASQVRGSIFVTCGTNGKTTTNNLLCSMLEAQGKKVVCNKLGANMLEGVTAAFAGAAGLGGNLDADYACIEIDEASAVRVFRYFKPDYMIITNLFRDQLDRYGEIDITMDILEKAIRMVPDMKLIVNGDDSLAAYLALRTGNPCVFYGISEQVVEGQETSREVREGRFCKNCGAQLEYDFYHYSQMGVYHCPSCSFKRPDIRYDASNVSFGKGLAFDVEGRHVEADYRGFYNIYNILAVWSALRESGIDTGKFDEVLGSYKPQFGRNELFHIGNAKVLLNLAKNPAGFNQNIAAVLEDESPKDLIIVINDNAQDGKDISWLWDVDFDSLSDESIRSITVSGIRGLDMQLRLKYVGIESSVTENTQAAIRKKLDEGSTNLYVLVNYTALYDAHKLLQEMEKKNGH